MAFKRHRLTALIEVDPDAAREEILRAFTEARACRADAASLIGCRRSTFTAWVARLKLEEQLALIEARAKFEDWHHGKVGGAGCHKIKRTTSKA